jgi:hypothetical protein
LVAVTDEGHLPPAGWYPDPLHNQKQRYWDGTQWAQNRDQASGLVAAGYLFAVVMPVVGFVIGIAAGTRRDPATRRHGPYILVASVAATVLWTTVVL